MSDNIIDTSRYVAIGDSVTAGYSDGALYYDAQLTAYPNLLAAQLKTHGSVKFKQPLTDKDSIGIGFWGNSRLTLKHITDSNSPTMLSYIAPQGDLNIFAE